MFVFCLCIYNKRLCKLGQINFAVLVGVHGLDHRLDGLITDGLVLVEKYDFAYFSTRTRHIYKNI